MLAFHEKHITGHMITYLVVTSEEITKAEYAALIKKKNAGMALPDVQDIEEVVLSASKARMAKTPAVGSTVTAGDTLESPKFIRKPTGVHGLKYVPERSEIDDLTEKLEHFDMISSHPGRIIQGQSKPQADAQVPPLILQASKLDSIRKSLDQNPLLGLRQDMKIKDDNPSLKTSYIEQSSQPRQLKPINQPVYQKQNTQAYHVTLYES